MWNLLDLLKRNLSKSLMVAMALGMVAGLSISSIQVLKASILPLSFVMIIPMMVTFPLAQLPRALKNPKLLWLNVTINLLFFPLLGWLIALTLPEEQVGLRLGLVLMALIPTSGMTVSWTGISKGNIEAAVSLMVLGLLVGAVVTPLALPLLLNSTVTINGLSIFIQVFILVIIPLIVGSALRLVMVKQMGHENFAARWKPRFPSISTFGVILIVFAATALKAKALVSKPETILVFILPLLAFYGLGYGFVALIGFKILAPAEAKALLFSTVMRNLSIALALVFNALPEQGSDGAVILSVAYLIQVQSASLVVRIMEKKAEKLEARQKELQSA